MRGKPMAELVSAGSINSGAVCRDRAPHVFYRIVSARRRALQRDALRIRGQDSDLVRRDPHGTFIFNHVIGCLPLNQALPTPGWIHDADVVRIATVRVSIVAPECCPASGF